MNQEYVSHMKAGMEFLSQGELAQAILEFRQALESAKKDEYAVMALMLSQHLVGEPEDALETYEVYYHELTQAEKDSQAPAGVLYMSISRGDTTYELYMTAGRGFQSQHQYDYAIRMFRLAWGQDSFSDEAVQSLMGAYANNDQVDEAHSVYEDFADYLAKQKPKKEPHPNTTRKYNILG